MLSVNYRNKSYRCCGKYVIKQKVKSKTCKDTIRGILLGLIRSYPSKLNVNPIVKQTTYSRNIPTRCFIFPNYFTLDSMDEVLRSVIISFSYYSILSKYPQL